MSEFRRRLMMANSGVTPPQYAVTRATNAPLMDIVYAKGWAANQDYMTMQEAAAVTGNVVSSFNSATLVIFDEFQYFTGIANRIGGNNFNKAVNLETITFSSATTTIGGYPFWNCPKLARFIFLGSTPPTIQGDTFNNIHRTASYVDCYIYVPDDAVNTYKTASANWENYAQYVKGMSELPT